MNTDESRYRVVSAGLVWSGTYWDSDDLVTSSSADDQLANALETGYNIVIDYIDDDERRFAE